MAADESSRGALPRTGRFTGTAVLDRMTVLYRLLHYVVVPVFLRLWARLRVEGRGHLPRDGPFILVSNHLDNWDTYLVGLFVRDRVINFLARPDGLRSPVLGWYWRQLGGIPADREGVALALRILKAGGAVGIFPEGVIAPALVRPLPGSAVLALRSGAPVVPAAVWGSERLHPWSILWPPRVVVRYGPPRRLQRGGRDAEAVMDDLMREIAAMLPPRYRGVYGGPHRRYRSGRCHARGADGAGDVAEPACRALGHRPHPRL
jgi:1-acyl-sn-glycerol-3-phosphate acyltransferase